MPLRFVRFSANEWPSELKVAQEVQSRTAEQMVLMNIRDWQAFQLESTPDFVIVCQSPQFTPIEADPILDECARMILRSSLTKTCCIEDPVR